jgi:hypothetical protein
MNSEENLEFTAFLKEAVRIVEKEGYKPQRFKSMLDAYGGFETVKRILETGKPSEGFSRLFEMGHLNLTCEAIIVESKWRPHFDEDLLERTEKLLTRSGYRFKRFEEAPVSSPEAVPQPELRSPPIPALASMAFGAGINAFFDLLLRAPVANPRWSWGAADHRTRRVFLRVWAHDVVASAGQVTIQVLGASGPPRPGRAERVRHLDLIGEGYGAYAVLCEMDGAEGKAIRGYDAERVYPLSALTVLEGSQFMVLGEPLPVANLPMPAASPDDIEKDLSDLDELRDRPTTKRAMVDARLGQGRYRRELLRRWDGACGVTGCRVEAVLRASHCKPWRQSEPHERLDSHNGIILSANLDALFDSGLISFEDDGAMLVSTALESTRDSILEGVPPRLLKKPSEKLKSYLVFHRDNVFQKRH